jgi:hypothetical protein
MKSATFSLSISSLRNRISRFIWLDEVCHRFFVNSRKAAKLHNIDTPFPGLTLGQKWLGAAKQLSCFRLTQACFLPSAPQLG